MFIIILWLTILWLVCIAIQYMSSICLNFRHCVKFRQIQTLKTRTCSTTVPLRSSRRSRAFIDVKKGPTASTACLIPSRQHTSCSVMSCASAFHAQVDVSLAKDGSSFLYDNRSSPKHFLPTTGKAVWNWLVLIDHVKAWAPLTETGL